MSDRQHPPKPGHIWHPEFRGPMSQPSEHSAAGVMTCLYCGESVNLWEGGYVYLPSSDVAHKGCAEYADEERSKVEHEYNERLDHEAMLEQGGD